MSFATSVRRRSPSETRPVATVRRGRQSGPQSGATGVQGPRILVCGSTLTEDHPAGTTRPNAARFGSQRRRHDRLLQWTIHSAATGTLAILRGDARCARVRTTTEGFLAIRTTPRPTVDHAWLSLPDFATRFPWWLKTLRHGSSGILGHGRHSEDPGPTAHSGAHISLSEGFTHFRAFCPRVQDPLGQMRLARDR